MNERVARGVVRMGLVDAGELFTLQLAAWVREGRANGTLEIPPLQDDLVDVQAQLANPVWTVWGWREAGRLLAMVRTRVQDDPSVAFIARLGVVPDLFRQGIGGAMLRLAESRLPADVRRIELVTGIHSVGNHAFYARHGYEIVARDPDVGIVHLAKVMA